MKSALSTTVLVLLVATFATEVLAAECFKPPFSRCNEKSFSNKDKKSKINIKLTDKELESLPTDIRKAIAAPGGIDPTRNVALAKAIAEYASRVSPRQLVNPVHDSEYWRSMDSHAGFARVVAEDPSLAMQLTKKGDTVVIEDGEGEGKCEEGDGHCLEVTATTPPPALV